MNADSYYEIGNGHKVCEDYAISGVYKDLAFAIVSDGCSESKNTDVGARLLSIIARDTLLYLYTRDILQESSISTIFKELVLKKCLEARSILNLSVNTFDATLLLAFSNENNAFIAGWGDGYIIIVRENGEKTIYELNFESGAPYYLSYRLDDGKYRNYMETHGEKILFSKEIFLDSEGIVTHSDEQESHCITETAIEKVFDIRDSQISKIILSSDGISTYYDDKKWIDPEGKEKKSYTALDIIPKIAGYKSTVGEFVTRRMSRMKKDMQRDHVLHDDDISCSAIDIQAK